MALFEKKTCDICGNKLGLSGRLKAADGIVCKSCAARLSPWAGDQKGATLYELRRQLVHREANRQLVADFDTSRSYGEKDRICMDAGRRQFMIVRTDNVTLENPDVIPYDKVTDCFYTVEEDRVEDLQKDERGKTVSFDPPQFHYLFDFVVTISVRDQDFDSLTFRLNKDSVSIPGGEAGVPASEREANMDYRRYVHAAEEIDGILTFRPDQGTVQAPLMACPSCGGVVTPDAAGCCPSCGTQITE